MMGSGMPYATNIWKSFSLLIESNAFRKSMKSETAGILFIWTSSQSQAVSHCGSAFPEAILVCSEDFLEVRFEAVEQHFVVDFYCDWYQAYTPIVLSVAQVTFLRKSV